MSTEQHWLPSWLCLPSCHTRLFNIGFGKIKLRYLCLCGKHFTRRTIFQSKDQIKISKKNKSVRCIFKKTLLRLAFVFVLFCLCECMHVRVSASIYRHSRGQRKVSGVDRFSTVGLDSVLRLVWRVLFVDHRASPPVIMRMVLMVICNPASGSFGSCSFL